MLHFHRSKAASGLVQVLQMTVVLSVATTGMALRLEPHQRRAAQTNAVCGAEYAWANTLEGGKSPCLVAAELLAPCNGGSAYLSCFCLRVWLKLTVLSGI